MKLSKILAPTVVAAAMMSLTPAISMADSDSDDESVFNMAAVILSMDDAVGIALSKVPGTVIGAELEAEDDAMVWEVSVMSEDQLISEVEIDANTGIVLEDDVEDD